MTTSNRLFGNISTIYVPTAQKPNFFTTAHHTNILLLRISQIFVYCKSANYLKTGNRLHIWLLSVEKLYDNFKSPISKHFSDLYGYCANPIFWLLRIYYFPTANISILYLLKIEQLFQQWKSST